ARGIPLVLVVFPPYERFDGTTDFDEPYAELDAVGAALGVPVIQLLPAFSLSLYFPWDRHLRPEGTGVAASTIARDLARLGLSGEVHPAPGLAARPCCVRAPGARTRGRARRRA